MRTRVLLGLLALGSIASCKEETRSPSGETHAAKAVDAAVASQNVTLTFLITGSENGYLLPAGDGTGGAAEVLGAWLRDEGHCIAPCDAKTIVLSTGDNANGQSISSAFKGQSTAELMKHMGYAASAFGNRELDWQREQFIANTTAGGFPYLAANLRAKDETGMALGLKPSVIIERGGLKVGIVGLAARKATLTPMAGRMAGLELISDEAALNEAIPALRRDRVDLIGIVTDACLHDVPALLEAHADWAPAFVAGRECGNEYPAKVGATALVYPGSRWREYARVKVTVDALAPQSKKVIGVETARVEVKGGAAEPQAAAKTAAWKQKRDALLGGVIGKTVTGLEQDSPEMSTWLATALKDQLKTDLGLINRKAVRQSLPPGEITSASIWDLVPFENEIVTLTVTGAQLLTAQENLEGRFAGLRGKTIDPKKTYTLATLDYLALGGDGFKLSEGALPEPSSQSVQSVVIAWTKAKAGKKPLESVIPK